MTQLPAETAEFATEVYGGAYLASFRYAENLIANCPTFHQDIMKAAGPEQARLGIHYQETNAEPDDEAEPERENDPPPELQPRPYCLLRDEKHTSKLVGTRTWAVDGVIIATFEIPIPDELLFDHGQDDAETKRDKWRRRVRWRMTLASKLLDEIKYRSGASDGGGNPYLNVIEPDLITPPCDADADLADAPFSAFEISLPYR